MNFIKEWQKIDKEYPEKRTITLGGEKYHLDTEPQKCPYCKASANYSPPAKKDWTLIGDKDADSNKIIAISKIECYNCHKEFKVELWQFEEI